jgi:hypothetical protein
MVPLGGSWSPPAPVPCQTQHSLARGFKDSWRVEMKIFRGWAITTVFGGCGGLFGLQSAGVDASALKQDWHTLVGLVVGEVAAFVVLT